MAKVTASSSKTSVPPQNPVIELKGKLENLNINEDLKDINILLLGCTGVGKSTFINSIANYLFYADFETALKRKLIVVIPTKIRVLDKHRKPHEVRVGEEDTNEYMQTGAAQTQFVKTYVFHVDCKNVKNIRFIDTPGIGDPRGIQQDDQNCENILNYISNLQHLHAICFLLKPNESKDTVFFKYCFSQIFSRLDKSACNNIIFCFTSTRGSDYNPGETLAVLEKNIDEIKRRPPHANIPLERNIFCFDNECFRYLAAVEANLELDDNLKDKISDSWKISVEEFRKLYRYITGDDHYPPLEPHGIRSTRAVNEARRTINRLAKPLADIGQLIQDNIYLLQRHEANLSLEKQTLDEVKSQLYIPVNTLEVSPLEYPTTVCTSRQCTDITQMGGRNVWHFKQRCHEPCYLGKVVSKDLIGDPNLKDCDAMDKKGFCRSCQCCYNVHMHVYYLTQQKIKREVDPNIEKNITTREQLLRNKKQFVKNLQVRQKELENENKIILEYSAKFAHFLQNNAITPFSDAYQQYAEYLIHREQSLPSEICHPDTVKNLKKLLSEYILLKAKYDEALKNARLVGDDNVVTPEDITNCLQNLYKLKHNGPKIKELYELQESLILKEHKTREYTFSKKIKMSPKSKQKPRHPQAQAPGYPMSYEYNSMGYPSYPMEYPLYPVGYPPYPFDPYPQNCEPAFNSESDSDDQDMNATNSRRGFSNVYPPEYYPPQNHFDTSVHGANSDEEEESSKTASSKRTNSKRGFCHVHYSQTPVGTSVQESDSDEEEESSKTTSTKRTNSRRGFSRDYYPQTPVGTSVQESDSDEEEQSSKTASSKRTNSRRGFSHVYYPQTPVRTSVQESESDDEEDSGSNRINASKVSYPISLRDPQRHHQVVSVPSIDQYRVAEPRPRSPTKVITNESLGVNLSTPVWNFQLAWQRQEHRE